MIHTVKGITVVNEAEIDVFLELSCFFDDPVDVGNLISGSSAFSKSSLYIGIFLVHVLLKPRLENFDHYFASTWDECNCAVVWTFFGIAILWYWNENWPFPVLWPLHPFSFPLTVYFSTSSLMFVSFWFFDSIHPNSCETISHCAFDLHFSDDEWCWGSFNVLVVHLFIFLEKCLFKSFGYFYH